MIKKNNYYLCKMETEKCIYFWKENNEFGFLSNFYISNFKDANFVKYNCNEKYFIAHKCLLFDGENDKLYNKIMQASIPYVIKRLGREVKNFDQSIWDSEKYDIMKTGLNYKFRQNKNLKKKLLETGDKTLYEASKFDKVWGIGITLEEVKKIEENNFPGKNLLGKALMEIRDELKKKK